MASAVKSEPAIILFDGMCNLCAGLVRFVAPRDPAGRFRFASLQSDVGRVLLERHGLPAGAFDTFVVIDGSRCHVRSDAALVLMARLGAPWRWLRWLRLIPRSVRDAVYDLVVRHRYCWFGRRESCLVPGPELNGRFLEEAPGAAATAGEARRLAQ